MEVAKKHPALGIIFKHDYCNILRKRDDFRQHIEKGRWFSSGYKNTKILKDSPCYEGVIYLKK